MISIEISTKKKYTFFLNAHETLMKEDYILVYKLNLNKFKRIEVIWSMLYDKNEIKHDINNKKITAKSQNT